MRASADYPGARVALDGPILAAVEDNSVQLSPDQLSVLPQPDPVVRPMTDETVVRGTGGKYIPVSEPTFIQASEELVASCLARNWISSNGSFVREFEELYAAFVGTKYCVACSSGTAALQLALAACGVGAGDEVIVPTFTMVAVGNSVAHLGATPVFVDVDRHSMNATPELLVGAVTNRTKAIVVVHTYGRPVDVESVLASVDTSRIAVIEDAAESHGAEIRGRRVGSLGHIGTFSFYANKIITTGEGGAITTNSRKLANVCRTLRDHAFSPERHFWHRYIGYNFRMTNLQAAVGVSQMSFIDDLIERRRNNGARYLRELGNERFLSLPSDLVDGKSVFWMFAVGVEPTCPVSRDVIRARLALMGIETRSGFVPLHLQPALRHYLLSREADLPRFPVAEELSARVFYLPSSGSLTDSETSFICRCVREALY